MGFFGNLFDDNAKDIKKYTKIVEQINALEPEISALSDEALKAKTDEFKSRIAADPELEPKDLMVEAFAVVREAAKRVLGMRHFDVQLIGGMVLSDGRIAEMKTGEGKTLVATAPAYLHALFGKGVHVITVNDYLASRDSEWMGRVYKFLGLSVGLIVHGLEPEQKQAAYAADITYGTNNEFGFDYLRDNMCFRKENMVQRPLHFAIVDEVDSILIDEARTPLIISGPATKSSDMYLKAASIVPRLRQKEDPDDPEAHGDFTIDLKTKQCALTEEGVAKVEQALGVENLYDPKNTELSHHINQALKAQFIFKRDRDYVVKDGQVIIVDEFTGRLMFGRRYSDGLHQAIEAKEHVAINRENQTLATITFQNYFRMYDKLSGMTGTARTEEEEFRKIYKLDVVVIPTNKPMQRIDNPDSIYRTEAGKFNAIIEELIAEHEKGRPVLVGTISIEKSELLSNMLKKRGVPHQVLNAKYHEKEAAIIAQAGREGAVTIATNMAGRGTDIVLGGNGEALAMAKIAEDAAKDKEYSDAERQELIEKYTAETRAEHDKIVELGGLHIIGTERHESRRIDNQLRGRAGRQGDPGSTRFFISMEDDLMKRFGGDGLRSILDRMGMDDSTPIDSNMVSRSIENAQKRVEERHFEARKTVLDYDDVMNAQRELIYSERRKALFEDDIHDSVLSMMDAAVDTVVGRYSGVSQFPEEWDLPALLQDMAAYLPTGMPTEAELKELSREEVYDLFKDKIAAYYEQREEDMGKEKLNLLEHAVVLQVVDRNWMDHLDAMDQLRQGIGLRAYGQENPLVAYKREAFDMFEGLVSDIQLEVTRMCMIAELIERPAERKDLTSNHGDAPAKKKPIRRKEQKIGRNDPCPCGSGKKYKNCCGRNA
ncbi:MAG: preprotein translocase subunit SecA [Firmicutes bacterium]|nr:preprotein translocase subunit SecA [Bacillota bacterium]